MTEKYTSQFAGTTESREKERLKKWVLRRLPEKLAQRMVQTSRD